RKREKNSKVKVKPAATPSSEAEVSKSSIQVAQGRTATEFPSQKTKEFDKEIASARIQAAPAAAPPADADLKTKSDSAAAPPVSRPSLAGSVGTAEQFSQQTAVQSFRNNAQQASRATNILNKLQVVHPRNEIL